MNAPSNRPPDAPSGTGWIEQSKQLLDESAANLDAATVSRLNRARQAALGQRRRRVREWLPVGAVAACTMLVALVLAQNHRHTHSGAPELPLAAHAETAGDVDLVSSEDSLEFYQDLEFYAWLEAQQQDQDLGS